MRRGGLNGVDERGKMNGDRGQKRETGAAQRGEREGAVGAYEGAIGPGGVGADRQTCKGGC